MRLLLSSMLLALHLQDPPSTPTNEDFNQSPAPSGDPPPRGPSLSATIDVTVEQRQGIDDPYAWWSTGDPTQAMASSVEAYCSYGASWSGRRSRHALLPRIATIHERLFGESGELEQLRQANLLLAAYMRGYNRYHPQTGASIQHLDAIKDRIQANENRSLDRCCVAEEADEWPDLARAAQRCPSASMKEVLHTDPALAPQWRMGRALVISGAVLLPLGGVVSTLSLPLMPGDSVRPPLLAVGIPTIAVGSTLLIVGLLRKRAVRRKAQERVVPAWPP